MNFIAPSNQPISASRSFHLSAIRSPAYFRRTSPSLSWQTYDRFTKGVSLKTWKRTFCSYIPRSSASPSHQAIQLIIIWNTFVFSWRVSRQQIAPPDIQQLSDYMWWPLWTIQRRYSYSRQLRHHQKVVKVQKTINLERSGRMRDDHKPISDAFDTRLRVSRMSAKIICNR
jgi:hypothetical protein